MCDEDFMTVSEAQVLYVYHELRLFYHMMSDCSLSDRAREECTESKLRAQVYANRLRDVHALVPEIHSAEARQWYAKISRAREVLHEERLKLNANHLSHNC
jgi:hypothetical protein